MTNPVMGEFLGSLILITFGSGVCANVLLSKSRASAGVLNGGWMAIVTGWAFAVMLGAFTSNALGGPGSMNPAGILLGVLAGAYTVSAAIPLMVAQVVGCLAGAVIVYLAYYPHWEVTEDKGVKLGVFATGSMIKNAPAALLCEIIATTMLFVCATAIGSKNVVGAGMTPGFGNYIVGTLIWALGLSLGGPTGYALNPARDLGPRIAHAILPIAGKGSSDWGYAWIPIVGPFIAAFVAYAVIQGFGIA